MLSNRMKGSRIESYNWYGKKREAYLLVRSDELRLLYSVVDRDTEYSLLQGDVLTVIIVISWGGFLLPKTGQNLERVNGIKSVSEV